MMKVKIYSTSRCIYCKKAKEYFNSRGIEFQEIDIGKDRKVLDEMIKISGQMGVPVIVVGKKVLVGFNQSEIEKALQTEALEIKNKK